MNWNLRETIEQEEKKRISNEELYEKQAQTLEILLDRGAINKFQYENGYQRLNVLRQIFFSFGYTEDKINVKLSG